MAAIVKRIRGQDLYKNVGENVIILGKVGMVSKLVFVYKPVNLMYLQ